MSTTKTPETCGETLTLPSPETSTGDLKASAGSKRSKPSTPRTTADRHVLLPTSSDGRCVRLKASKDGGLVYIPGSKPSSMGELSLIFAAHGWLLTVSDTDEYILIELTRALQKPWRGSRSRLSRKLAFEAE